MLTTTRFNLFYVTRQFLQRKGARNEGLISGAGLGAGEGTWWEVGAVIGGQEEGPGEMRPISPEGKFHSAPCCPQGE